MDDDNISVAAWCQNLIVSGPYSLTLDHPNSTTRSLIGDRCFSEETKSVEVSFRQRRVARRLCVVEKLNGMENIRL